MFRKRGCFFFFAALLAGCLSHQPAPVAFARPAVEDPEVRISREFRREARKRLKLIQHPEVERYINQVGQRILAAIGPQPFEYRFFVVENPQLNAFAVPGGSIYMHTGLIDRVSSTDEIAGVLAHEIAHVHGHHAARMAGGPDPLTLLSLLGVFLGGSGPQAALTLGQALAVTRQLSYNRQLEQEADTFGVKYMTAAGYDPQAALRFLKTVDQERMLNPIEIPPYLMTHPLSQERIVGVESAIRSLALKRSRSDSPDPIKRIQTLLRLERHEGDAVVAQYEKALSENPNSAEAAHLLGLTHYHGGRWAKAAEYLERARAADPKAPGIDRDLGRLYMQTGAFALARAALERALAAEPGEPLNYLLLGELYEKESKLAEAAGAYAQAHQMAPLWPTPARQLGIVYGKMNRLGDAYYHLARSHLLADEDELAIADLERALKHVGPASPRGEVIREELETIKARRR